MPPVPPPNGSQSIKRRPSQAHPHTPPGMMQSEVTKETALSLLALHCENGGTRGSANHHVIAFKNGEHPLENQDIV